MDWNASPLSCRTWKASTTSWVVGPDGRPVKYGEIRLQDELQFSVYNFEHADVEKAWQHLRLYEAECQSLLDQYAEGIAHSGRDKQGKPSKGEASNTKFNTIERKRFPVLGAFDLCLKCSHLFNILDARGAISVTERVGVIARIRALAVGVAKAYVDQQITEQQGEPKFVAKPDNVAVE